MTKQFNATFELLKLIRAARKEGVSLKVTYAKKLFFAIK